MPTKKSLEKMKGKNQKKRGPVGGKKGGSSHIKDDPFFSSETRKKRKYDEDIESEEEEDELLSSGGEEGGDEEGGEEKEEDMETVDEKRKRVAEAHLDKLRKIAQREEEEGSEEEGDARYEKEGERDSLVASKLMKEQMEDSGRLRREIASRIQMPETSGGFQLHVKHRNPVSAVCLSDDDSKGFSAAKDGIILQWDVDSGKTDKYRWPSDEMLKSHGAKEPQGRVKKHSRNVSALAVSPDGRYLAAGGSDRHIHLWDTRTREHIQSFSGHRGTVSSLTFRQGTSELFSGSFDRSVKIWNVEDRAYIQTLFGHQSEVLMVDCLRKERVLAVGRDRTMQLFKVPEESRLIFRASQSSLECCCFIDNDDFLSGSDDGSIELWSMQKKKPVSIVKNAHAILADQPDTEKRDNGMSNGHLEHYKSASAYSWVSSVAVCRGSDLAASGAGNGCVRLWAVENNFNNLKGLRPLFDLPLVSENYRRGKLFFVGTNGVGFVNSLALARSGAFLVGGVGKEPRLGRWGQISSARNGVFIQQLKLS